EGRIMPARGFGALALWVMLSCLGASTAGAQCAAPACSGTADCSVNDSSGVDGPGCCTSSKGCKTIQFAVDQPALPSGAVSKVVAGTYPEGPGRLIIDKTVTLCGAKAGVDARTPRGSDESIITNPLGTTVSKSKVIVDGFTFAGDTSSIFPFGLDMAQ